MAFVKNVTVSTLFRLIVMYLETVILAEGKSNEVAEFVARDFGVVSQSFEASFDGSVVWVGFGNCLDVSLYQALHSIGLQEVQLRVSNKECDPRCSNHRGIFMLRLMKRNRAASQFVPLSVLLKQKLT